MAAAVPWIIGIGAGGAGTAIAGKAIKRNLQPKINVPEVPKPPMIDDARRNLDEVDRIRRRRGVLANIYGGSSASSSPSVGTKQLLGGGQ